jgi:hypothetical protein
MKTRKFIKLAAGLTLILILLTACDGGIETNFSVNNDGVGFPFNEPNFYAYETLTIELPIVNHKSIWLEAVRGDIEIEGQVDANSVIVTAEKRVGSDSLEDAEEHMNELEILATDQIDEFIIQTLQPGNTQGRKYIVDYHIILPIDMEIEVTLTNGNISVQDVENSVMVDAVNGNVFLSNVFGSAVVDLTNGSIDSTMVLPLDGEIRMSTDNGNIDLSIPTSTSAIFAASVTNGSIRTYNLEFDAAVQTTKLVTGTLGIGEGVIDLDSINGHISVVGFD